MAVNRRLGLVEIIALVVIITFFTVLFFGMFFSPSHAVPLEQVKPVDRCNLQLELDKCVMQLVEFRGHRVYVLPGTGIMHDPDCDCLSAKIIR